jgi:hypothetical protein
MPRWSVVIVKQPSDINRPRPLKVTFSRPARASRQQACGRSLTCSWTFRSCRTRRYAHSKDYIALTLFCHDRVLHSIRQLASIHVVVTRLVAILCVYVQHNVLPVKKATKGDQRVANQLLMKALAKKTLLSASSSQSTSKHM